jgi:hypothetical protein
VLSTDSCRCSQPPIADVTTAIDLIGAVTAVWLVRGRGRTLAEVPEQQAAIRSMHGLRAQGRKPAADRGRHERGRAFDFPRGRCWCAAERARRAVRHNLFFVAVVLLATIAIMAVVWIAPSDSERLRSFQAECAAAGFNAEQRAFLFNLSAHGRSPDAADATVHSA